MESIEKKYQVGVDIGATKANIGIIDKQGKIYVIQKIKTGNEEPSEKILNDIADKIKSCMNEVDLTIDDVGFIGVGVPGTVNKEGTCVVYAPNLNWKNVELVRILKSVFPIEIKVEQDAKAAAAGELLAGAGRGMSDIVCLTLGSGIGGGIIIDRKIFSGALNTAGEVGHIVVHPGGSQCNCGKRGCVEAYGAGLGLQRKALEVFGREVTSEELFDMEKQGDSNAKRIIDAGAEALGICIVNVVNTLSPQAVILSGGITHQQSYVNRIKEFVYENAYGLAIDKEKFIFCTAELGADAPMVGAGLLNLLK